MGNQPPEPIFPSLGTRRITGKPHTVSEYNHPVPNQYAAEGLPMLCAFARFQGWDGVFQYTYAHQLKEEPEKLTGYFDAISQVGQLVHAPACANIMLRKDVASAKEMFFVSMSREEELLAISQIYSPWTQQIGFATFERDSRLALLHATSLDLSGHQRQARDFPVIPTDQKVFVSDTGELTWNMEKAGKGYFLLKTPKTKVFSGFVPDDPVDLGDGVILFIGNTRLGWATITLTEIAPKRWLVAASGYMQNTDMKFVKYGTSDDDHYTVNNNWGTGPVLCEGIPMSVIFPRNQGLTQAYVLDAAGNRTKKIGALNVIESTFMLSPLNRTLWYEIVGE